MWRFSLCLVLFSLALGNLSNAQPAPERKELKMRKQEEKAVAKQEKAAVKEEKVAARQERIAAKVQKDNFGKTVTAEVRRLREEGNKQPRMGQWVSEQRRKDGAKPAMEKRAVPAERAPAANPVSPKTSDRQ
jgi:hypothetical protein